VSKCTINIAILLIMVVSTVYAATMDELMNYIAIKHGPELSKRLITTDPKSFPDKNANYIKINKDGLIIFKETSIPSESGNVIVYGVTRVGEVLQYIERKHQVVLINPLSNDIDTTGYWYQVKTVDGYVGWIYAGKDEDQIKNFLTLFNMGEMKRNNDRKEVGTTKVSNIFWAVIALIGIYVLFSIVRSLSKEKSYGGYSSGGAWNSNNKESASSVSSGSESASSASISSSYGRTIIHTSSGVIKEHSSYPIAAKQTHHVHKNELGGDDEIHEGSWGSHKVGTIDKDWLGNPISLTLNGETYKIKIRSLGDKVLVDKDGNEVADFED